MRKLIFITLAFCCALFVQASAQCSFNPTVTGNLLVCPQSTTALSTQNYSAYQWYSRPYGSQSAQPVAGAAAQTFEVGFLETPVYVSVAATLDGCTEQSPEVLVDGITFLPPTVLTEGDFTIGSNGELLICSGDSVWMVALQPYTVNLQWYNNNVAIPGATHDTLVVTSPGEYSMSGSPAPCPNLVLPLGVNISVVWDNTPGCVVSAPEPIAQLPAVVTPNPASTRVHVVVESAAEVSLTLWNAAGACLRSLTFRRQTELDLRSLPNGVYHLGLFAEGKSASKPLIISHE